MGQNCKLLQISLILVILLFAGSSAHAFEKIEKGKLGLYFSIAHIQSNRYYDGNGNLHHSPYFNFSETLFSLKAEYAPTGWFSIFSTLTFVRRTGSVYFSAFFFYPEGWVTLRSIPVSASVSGLGDSTIGAVFYLDQFFEFISFPRIKLRGALEFTLPTGDDLGKVHNNYLTRPSRLPTGTGQTDISLKGEGSVRAKWMEFFLSAKVTFRTSTSGLKGWIATAYPLSIAPGHFMTLDAELRFHLSGKLSLLIGHSYFLTFPHTFKIRFEDLFSPGSIYYVKTGNSALNTLFAGFRYGGENGLFVSLSFHLPVRGRNYPEDPNYVLPNDPYDVGGVQDVSGLFLVNRFPEVPGFYTLFTIGYER